MQNASDLKTCLAPPVIAARGGYRALPPDGGAALEHRVRGTLTAPAGCSMNGKRAIVERAHLLSA